MSLNASSVEIDEPCRKRQIEEVADAEAPPKPSRPRVSPEQEVENGDSSDHDQDGDRHPSVTDPKSTSEWEEGSDNSDTRDSSYEHNGDEVVDPYHTLVKQEDHVLHLDSCAIPQSWEEASNADRILVRMKSKGLSWDEIGKAWKEETGQDTAHIVLVNRYNRLKDNVQILREGDSERLLAAVEEVKAIFERDKWRLVKNAMIRAGAAEYSKRFIQKQYEKLAQGSQHTDATGSHNGEKIENSMGIGSMEESHVANGTTIADLASVKTVHTSMGLQPIETVNTSSDLPPNNAKVPIGTSPVIVTTAQKSKEPGAAKAGAHTKGVTEAPNTVGKETAKGQLPAKSGALALNAILADDTDLVPSPVPKVNGAVTSDLKVVANPTTPGSQLSAATPAIVPRPGPSLSITSSRVGSVTNRGPASLTSLLKATDDHATRKQRKTLNSSPDFPRHEPGKPPVDTLPGGCGILVKNQTLNCTNVQQRMAIQQEPSAEHGSPSIQSHPQHAPRLLPAQPTLASTNESASTQHFITSPPVAHDLPVGGAPTRPLPSHKPSDIEAPLQGEGPRERSPIQSIEVISQTKPVITNNVGDALSALGVSSGSLKMAVTTDQIKHMLKHKTLIDANWSKSWEVIAQECGVIATLAEISVALERAGLLSILNASEPLRPADYAGSASSTEPNIHVSPYAPHPPSQNPPVTKASVSPAVSAALAKAFETPPPATITSQDGTPTTGSRRGRPRGSKNKPKYQVPGDESSISPSQVGTPVSGQKRHFKSAETKAAQSAAMKAAWKRRKEKGTDGWKGGVPKPSTTGGQSFVDTITATFAADILAAAAASTEAVSTLAPQSTRASVIPTSPNPLDDEPVDLLTGESMFARHYDDPPPNPFLGPPPAKKIVRRSTTLQPI